MVAAMLRMDGITSDTAEFAVQSIRSWLGRMGRPRYSKMKELTITADCGGSNGARVRSGKSNCRGSPTKRGWRPTPTTIRRGRRGGALHLQRFPDIVVVLLLELVKLISLIVFYLQICLPVPNTQAFPFGHCQPRPLLPSWQW